MQEWTKETPAGWDAALREFSPISTVVPWLAIRWFPMRRVLNGIPTDCGRWLLSECVPVENLSEIDRDILNYLQGPKPSTLPPSRARVVKVFCNDYQWEMYRTHKVWARELWLLQGSNGGHATHYQPEEQQLLQVMGLPTDPPAVGDLPYAPLDARVFAALHRRNRLVALGNNLARWKASGSSAAMASEYRDSQRQFRAQYMGFLEDQVREIADLTAFVTRKAEQRDSLPTTSREAMNAASRLDEYLETGTIPSAA